MQRRSLVLGGFSLAVPALPGSAGAQAWPSQPIRWIVPYPPDGATDVLSRAVAEEMKNGLGQPIVIDNKAGAAGIVGTECTPRRRSGAS